MIISRLQDSHVSMADFYFSCELVVVVVVVHVEGIRLCI
jgi:hypothetical protein